MGLTRSAVLSFSNVEFAGLNIPSLNDAALHWKGYALDMQNHTKGPFCCIISST